MKKKLLQNPIFYLFLLCTCEILAISYCRNIAGYYVSPLILFLVSISIGVIPMLFISVDKIKEAHVLFQIRDKHSLYVVGLFLAFVILFLFVPRGGIVNIYKCFPVDVRFSDIIPTIQTMCRRLLNHQPIYVSIEEYGYHLPTTYMPFMWLPYVVAEQFHFDYRWITLFIFVFGIVVVLFTTIRTENKGWLISLLYILLVLTLVEKNTDVLGWSVETMNGLYYSILAISFFSHNKYLKAVALAICLLSRYSLVMFVPLYFIIEWNDNGLKRTLYFALLTLMLIILFLLPLVKNNWMELYNGYKYYSISGLGEWKHLNTNGLPLHLFNGNGFAAWTYNFKSGTIQERFAFARSLHMALVLATTIILTIVYFITRKQINHRLFLLCSLKIYLAVFYSFIQVPYSYLFIVPVMYSIVLVLLVNDVSHKNINELKPIE